MAAGHSLTLRALDGRLAVVRLDAGAALPAWVPARGFLSIARTDRELSIVCEDSAVPRSAMAERGWRAIEVAGPLDFGLTGVLASLARPLADAGVSIFAVSTYDTDYVLVREAALDQARAALEAAGHVWAPRPA
ncbi:MAG: ACT domain-containing protein [Vicinamibacterales bacterium]